MSFLPLVLASFFIGFLVILFVGNSDNRSKRFIRYSSVISLLFLSYLLIFFSGLIGGAILVSSYSIVIVAILSSYYSSKYAMAIIAVVGIIITILLLPITEGRNWYSLINFPDRIACGGCGGSFSDKLLITVSIIHLVVVFYSYFINIKFIDNISLAGQDWFYNTSFGRFIHKTSDRRVAFSIFIGLIAFIFSELYMLYKGMGFDTIEGALSTHLIPAIISFFIVYAMNLNSNKIKYARFKFYLLLVFIFNAVIIEFLYRNIDNLFY